MPNGYGSAMRVFTEIYKVPFGHLRSLGHNCCVCRSFISPRQNIPGFS